jgi:hypothetical protein
MEKSNFALRLLPSLHKAAQRVADREDCSLNQLINLALAEKIAVLDADHWRERKRAGAKMPKSDVLRRLAGNEPPREGDELPPRISNRNASARKILTAGGR